EQQQTLALALERARYEAERARRQYDAVEPENRLVAGELERRWNSALARVAELEAAQGAGQHRAAPVSAAERARLLALGRDLAALWRHPAAAPEGKKRLLRAVLREVVIADNAEGK